MATERANQLDDGVRVVDADAEDERVGREHRVVDGVVDDDAADVLRALGVAVDDLQERGAEIVENPAEARARTQVHRFEHHPMVGTGAPSLLRPCGPNETLSSSGPTTAQAETHSVAVVTAASSSASGSTPRPGPVGTRRWPSSRTNGSVMSVR